MSVLRPRPPTDPIEHHPPPGVLSADGRTDPRWQAWLDRAEQVRGAVASACGTETEGMLEAYGTTRSQAHRRDSALFGILAAARQIRESVDRVIVIGDRADRALVDLLVSTCCHPRHDDLPRHERGGRPRIWTLGPDDDDDTVQGILDALGPQTGDWLLDAWGVVQAGPCREAFTQDCVGLFAAAPDSTGRPGAGPTLVVAAAVDPSGPGAVSVGQGGQKHVQKALSRSDGSWALRWNTVRSSVNITTTNAAKAAQWAKWIGPTAAAGASAAARIGNQACKAGGSLSDRVYG